MIFNMTLKRYKYDLTEWSLEDLMRNVQLLTGAHCACQFTAVDIRFTRKGTTLSFDKVKQCSIDISMSSSHVIGILVNTSVHCSVMTKVCSHQVTLVLACPTRGTHVCTWNHHQSGSSVHVTQGTRDVMILKTVGKYPIWLTFIFSSIYSSSSLKPV